MNFFTVTLLFSLTALSPLRTVLSEEGKTWAILISGCDYYKWTYAFEGAVYKMYNILREQGIPPEQIITFSGDSAAYHPDNLNPGAVSYGFGSGLLENSPNYYENVIIDYRKAFPESVFYQVLGGNFNKTLLDYGSGKVLKSGPNDNVYIYYIGIGYYGLFLLSNGAMTYAHTFIPFIEELKEKKRFKNLFINFESMYSGSIFDEYLEKEGILVYSLGGRYNQLYFCHPNKELTAYTSTCSSFAQFVYLEKSFSTVQGDESILNYFQNAAVLGAAVPGIVHNLYGQIPMATMSINHFLGQKKSSNEASAKTIPKQAANLDIEPLKKLVAQEVKNGKSILELIEEDENVPESERIRINHVMKAIVKESMKGTNYPYEADEEVKKSSAGKFDCTGKVFEEIRLRCFTQQNQHLFFLQAETLKKLCSYDVPEKNIMAAISNIC